MRIVVFLILSLSLLGCKLDVEDDYHVEKIPAHSIEVPDNYTLGNQFVIPFSYDLPNGCYEFFNIEYEETNAFTRIITPFARVENAENCTLLFREETYNLAVTLSDSGVYAFKFWVGVSSSGTQLYETYELVID